MFEIFILNIYLKLLTYTTKLHSNKMMWHAEVTQQETSCQSLNLTSWMIT